MINSPQDYKNEAYNKILRIADMKKAYKVIGVYDFILQLEEKDLESLQKILTSQIRSVKELLSTLTLVIIS